MVVIRAGEKIVSHSVVDFVDLTTNGLTLKLGIIGSLVTDPNFRKRGFGRQCIEKCLELSVEQGCDISVLWTYDYDFYRKLNFERAGHEICAYLEKSSFSKQDGVLFAEESLAAGPKLAAETLDLYNSHSVRVSRSRELQEQYLKIPKVRFFAARNAEGKLLAYTFEGKGADLTACLHDWAGPTDIVSNLFHFAKEKLGTTVIVMIPGYRADVAARLEPVAKRVARNPFGMIQILNHEAIIEKLTTAEPTDVGSLLSAYRKLNGPLQAPGFFFGDLDLNEVQLTIDEKRVYEKYLPIPIWVWGMDAV